MAILKNLIVNGSSKFLNKAYFQDVQIGGTATLSSLSLSGTLTVNGATTINNALNVTGTSTINKIIASNFIVNNGIELYHNTPFIDFHFGNSTTDYTSRIIESSSGTLHIANNLTIASTISAPTGVIPTLNSTNVNVTNNLRANHYDLQTVAQLGGSFYVSPTVKFPNSGTTLKVEKSGSTLTLTITDSSITSATMAGVVWTAGSGVKVSGTINGVVTGTMDGTVSSINTSSHTLTLSVSGENSGNVQASPSGNPYNASQFKDLSIMLYTRKQDGTIKMTNVASGAIASFPDGADNVPVKSLTVAIEPVQSGSGDPSPDNVRPISGHTQAVVTRTGRNLIPSPNSQVLNGITVTHNNDGSISITGTASDGTTISGPSIGKLKSGTYTISISEGLPENVWVSISNSTKLITYRNSIVKTGTVDAIDNAHVHIYINKGVTIDTTLTIMLEVGNAATAYEPYTVQTVTISLNGTRYGGTLDVGSGVLTVDKGYKLLNGVNGDGVAYRRNGHTANTTRAFVTINDKAYGVDNIMSSSFHVSNADAVGSIYGRAASNGVEFYLDASVPDTDAGIMAWFVDNPTNFVYELAEPFTVQLSKTEVRTLQGYNNIWSNTGDTNVIYESSQVDSTNNYNVGIWMNCYDQANSSSTIRVYNGSSRWPNVFLGNMTNADLPRVNGNAPYGYGLYSDNVFLRGIISATGGLIGNWTIGTTGMFYNSDAPGSTSITMIPGGTAVSTTSIGGSSGSKSWIFTGKNLFGIDTTGKLYASSAEISGKITANSGSIAGWRIESTYLASGTATAPAANTLLLSPAGTSSSYTVAGTAKSGWMITAGTTFGVDKDGGVYATSGKIGGWTLDASSLYTGTKTETSSIIVSSADVTRTINGASRTGLRLVVGSNFGVSNTGVIYANSANISGTLNAGANSQIGPWTVTTTSIYKGENTLGSTTSGAAYFGDLGLSIGNKFKVDASGDGAIILGELAEGKTHVEVDSDSFDVCVGANTGSNASKIASFGENVVLGNENESQFVISSNSIRGVVGDNIDAFRFSISDAEMSSTRRWSKEVSDKDGTRNIPLNIAGLSTGATIHFQLNATKNQIRDGTIISYDFTYGTSVDNVPFSMDNGISLQLHYNGTDLINYHIVFNKNDERVHSLFITFTSYTYGPYFSLGTRDEDGSFGGYSCTIGYNNIAYGAYSCAMGVGTIASKSEQLAIGCYNKEDTSQSNNLLFIIGNGVSTWRSNAFTVDWSGNVVASGSLNAESFTTTGDITASGNITAPNLKHTISSASGSVTITSSNTIDNTPAKGASLTLSAGTYILIARGTFNSGSSSGNRNNQIAIYTGASPTNSTMINESMERIYAAGNAWGALITSCVVQPTASTKYTVGLTSSIPSSSTCNTTLKAVKLHV